MPHLTLELSEKFPLDDPHALLTACNQALFATGVFQSKQDIKSRLYVAPYSLIGTGDDGEHFVFAKLQLLAGRDDATKAHLVKTLLETISGQLGQHATDAQYAVDIAELSPFYQKAVL